MSSVSQKRADREAALEYLLSMTRQARDLAGEQGLDFTVYLLDMAVVQTAEDLDKQRSLPDC